MTEDEITRVAAQALADLISTLPKGSNVVLAVAPANNGPRIALVSSLGESDTMRVLRGAIRELADEAEPPLQFIH